MYSITGIYLSLTLEQVGLVLTTNQSILISNQNFKKQFKGLLLTMFLVCMPFGVEFQYENIKWCSQIYQDQLNDLSILLLVALSKFSEPQPEFLNMHKIVLHSLKGMRIERDQIFL
jgi:hypothetical protein